MRLPDPSPALDKNHAPMGPEILSSTGAGVWRKAPMAFPDSSSVLDKFQSAKSASPISRVCPVNQVFLGKSAPLSGVAPANQTKERSVHELFAGAFRNKSSM